MKQFDVIGVGALNIDYIHKIQTITAQKETHINDSLTHAGGSAGNTLCGLARLGLRTGAIGRVGIDDKANILIKSFYDYGVDFSQISIDRKSNTGYAHVYVDNFGKRTMFVKPSSNDTLDKQHINEKYVLSASWLHFSDFIDEKQFFLQLWLAKRLTRNSKTSLWLDGHIVKLGYKEIHKIFPYIDILFIKEDVLNQFVGMETFEAAEKLLSDGIKTIIIIHTVFESTVVTKQEKHTVNNIKTAIVDETGISCAYAAGFIFGQMRDFSLKYSAFLGNTFMSFCAEKIGCRSNLPTLQELTKRTSLLKEDKNVLLIGSGGREHAIAWKLHQSPRVRRLYAAPGNPGIAEVAHTVPIKETDLKKLKKFVKKKEIDITIVGPEVPLGMGIVDYFEKDGLLIFGPSKKAAEIETSKAFSKRFMKRFNIPTAKCKVFISYKRAQSYLGKTNYPVVIKADGLAAGKGVVICEDKQTAETWLRKMMLEAVFGDAGKRVIIEEFLQGEEASILAFSDGEHIIPLLPSQDHKRIYDDDKGPNTGGMGAYAPAPIVDAALLETVVKTILKPTIQGLKKIGRPYKGILYAGIIITREGPKTLEFNCRFGDPETQAILPLLKTDLLSIIETVLLGKLENISLDWENKACVCVIAAAGGYPTNPETGKEIKGLNCSALSAKIAVFHAGTKSKIVTAGGRVFGIVSTGDNLQGALKAAYKELNHISFENMHHRRDIGKKALKHT